MIAFLLLSAALWQRNLSTAKGGPALPSRGHCHLLNILGELLLENPRLGVRSGQEREERRREEEKLSTTDVDLSHVGAEPQAPRHPTKIYPTSGSRLLVRAAS
ncbi:hypothetical protein ACN38_g2156 [Penicillium nordicum]|uniref:Uncharacterized protein n=1 Tax=Penicillium nordicum TaxID=229535 RepID=A0A0M8P7F7_9EURO|nr:hypothetical protein ACN38_g2156 [Penicillium nordicum]